MERKRILLIDDDKCIVKNVKDFLTEEGFEVDTAYDGKSGIKIKTNWNPDLIICDINMPNMDGFEVLSELSNDLFSQTIPFIFLTAKTENSDFRRGMQLGADDYIFKPFDLDDLLKSVLIRLEKADNHKNGIGTNEKKNKLELEDKIFYKNKKNINSELVKDLKFIKAESPYVILKFADNTIVVKRETISQWESKLPSNYFIKIHRSTIINSNFISNVEKKSSTSLLVHLKNENNTFVLSKRTASVLKNKFFHV